MGEAWIIDGVRTPRGKGKPGGSLHGIHPQELLAQTLKALEARTGIDPALVEDVVVGNGSNTGDHSNDIGRWAALSAGWPVGVPGVTLNRFCGSGLQAAMVAAMGVSSGWQQAVVAGGVESMSRYDDAMRAPMGGGNDGLLERYPLVPQGISADLIATLEGFSRTEVDRYAQRSQERTATAVAEGRFGRSLVPVVGPDGAVALDRDEHPRPGVTVDSLAELPPSFLKAGAKPRGTEGRSYDDMALSVYPQAGAVEHVHHAGNSSGVVDGAASLLVVAPEFARAHGLRPRARILGGAVAGVDPVIMLTAPGPAAEAALAKVGMTASDVDLWEVNEAFAAVPMKFARDMDVDDDALNVNGGAIALGHPIGATGIILLQTVLDELERRDLNTGLVALCTGGGMANAAVVERI